MNGRERVLMTLDHQKTDRVALDLGGRQTTMTINALERYKKHFGINSETYVMSDRWQTAYINEEILRRYHIDTRHIRPPSRVNENLIKKGIQPKGPDNTFIDEWGVVRKVAGDYANIIHHPLQQIVAIEDLEKFDWPVQPEEDYPADGLREYAQKLLEDGEFALIGCMGNACNVFEGAWYMRGLSEFFMDLAADQDLARALMRRVTDIRKKNIKYFLEAVGDYIDIFQMADDLASQSSLLISVDMYKEMIKPFHIELIQYAQQFTKAKIFYHSCGAIEPLIDELIDNGVSILNPVQVSAEGMDTAYLKKRYGKHLTFWGGIDTLEVLCHGTTDQVRDEVKKRIHDLAVNGGYVLGPVHNIQSDVPPENVEMMYQTALVEQVR